MANVLKFYGFEFSSASHASPELSSAQSCFKGTLTVANIIFLIFGCVLCGVGAYAMQSKAGALAGQSLPQGIIAVGVFIILVSLLGCVAAFKESRCLLGIYCAFLSLFSIILAAIGVGVLAKKDSAPTYMADGWCAAIPAVQSDIQTYFSCCGLNYFNDSLARHQDALGTQPAFEVPAACPSYAQKSPYGTTPLACPKGMNENNGLPCLPILTTAFMSSYQAAGACGIAFAVLMGIGMIIVCVLMSGIKEKRHLEDIRKLHRRLREAKEDPTAGGLAGLNRGGDAGVGLEGDSGYGEVDLAGVGGGYAAGSVDAGHDGSAIGLDQDVQLDMSQGQQEHDDAATGVAADYEEQEQQQQHYVVGKKQAAGRGAGRAAAAMGTARNPVGGKAAKKGRFAEPEVDEEPYEQETSAPAGGYAQADEYDEEN